MARKKKGSSVNRFDDLPAVLVKDILSRLCVKSILKCRRVYKPWLFMTSDSDFARLQLKRSSGIGILVKPKQKSNKIDFYHIQDKSAAGSDLEVQRLRFGPEKNLPFSCFKSHYEITLGNSCNGFVCLFTHWEIYVCNPILGEYMTILTNHVLTQDCVALGFNGKTNEYKVLRINQKWTGQFHEYAVEIHTIGTGVWRSLGQVSEEYHVSSLPFNSLVHGSLHWVPDKNFTTAGSTDLIIYFNFEREQFGSLSAPPQDCLKYAKIERLTLGVLHGNLILCAFYPTKFEMWVMNEYGLQVSWSNMLVYNDFPKHHWRYETYEPLMFLGDGGFLMKKNYSHKVLRFHPAQNSLNDARIIRTRSTFDGIGYTPCFVSLNDISNGEEVKRVRKNKRYEKLLAEGNGCGIPLRESKNDGGFAVEESAHNIATSSSSHAQLDLTLRIATECARCGAKLGYVFRGKGFAMCQACFDASSS